MMLPRLAPRTAFAARCSRPQLLSGTILTGLPLRSATRGMAAAAGGHPCPGDTKIHDPLMRRLTTPRDPANYLLHDMWEPWARQAGYVGHRTWPFYDERADRQSYMLRREGIQYCSWAVPSAEALDTIAAASGGRVVEVGCGMGYWASLLARRGVDVAAVDNGSETGRETGKFFPQFVKADGVEYLREHGGCADRALFMCWARGYAEEVMKAYKGDTVVWVGEQDGATWELTEEDYPEWRLEKQLVIPTWALIHDELFVHKRVGA